MRIVMLSKAVVVGAYQRKLEELARLPDIDLTVLTPAFWRDSRGETRLEPVFTEGYRLVTTPIALAGHFHAHFYPHLGRELQAARPDLLHIDEEPYNLATWQAMRWAAGHDVPTLFFTWQNLCRRYPPPFNWLEGYNYAQAVHAIAGNREAAEVLRAKGFARPISVIPQFGVDPELFQPSAGQETTPFRPAGPDLVVGYAGGFIPEKGLDLLLRAVAACNRQTVVCRLLLAGEGPLREKLAALASQLGIQDRIIFLGRIGSTRMPDFYASIDVLVLPSRTMANWKEQFGRVLIEAMASGVAVIGSDSGEIPHVIGDAGWTFPEDDDEALAGRLISLVQSPEQRQILAEKGRQRVLALYTQQAIAKATYDVYRQILGR